MLEYDGVSDLQKAALKRLKDARELLEPPTYERAGADADHRHLCAAEYLAGYAVECALKAAIIHRTEARQGRWTKRWSQVLALRQGRKPDLSGANSHDLDALLAVSQLEGELRAYQAMWESWSTCRKWKPAWRYRSQPVAREHATGMVQACEDAYKWLRTQW